MKIVKLVIISAVILFLLITALSLLLPSHVRISRAIDINAQKENIMPFVANLQEWKKWNRFVLVADSMHELQQISSSSIQAGDLQIKMGQQQVNGVETIWLQNKNESHANIVCLPGAGYTTVQWYFDFHLDWYPWQKFQSIIYDKQLGPQMEASLENLKRLAETP